jgi:excisionase family DNA binding protein
MQNHSPTLEEPLAHTIEEAARRSTLSPSNVRAIILRGELKARKMGRRTLILDEDLRAWLAGLPSAIPEA